jgi:hypothetical protein
MNWPNGYGYRYAVQIDNTKVPNTDRTDFPFLFSGTYAFLAGTGSGGYATSASGYDIIFTSDPAGSVVLDHEIEVYTAATGVVSIWVRIPTVYTAVPTTIYLFVGNSAVTTSQEDIHGVWGTRHKGVWHFPNGASLSGADSSSGGYDFSNGTASAGTGKVDGGVGITAGNSYAATTFPSENLANITFSFWVNGSSLPSYATLATAAWGVYVQAVPQAYVALYASIGGFAEPTSTTQLQTGTWYHIAVTYDGANARTYINGVLENTKATTGTVAVGNNQPAVGGNNFAGVIDEFRILNVALSADELLTGVHNQNSPSTFYAMGSVMTTGRSPSGGAAYSSPMFY